MKRQTSVLKLAGSLSLKRPLLAPEQERHEYGEIIARKWAKRMKKSFPTH
jgi:hypothetical protein